MLSRDDLAREIRAQSGNPAALILVYIVIVGTMVGSALLIL